MERTLVALSWLVCLACSAPESRGSSEPTGPQSAGRVAESIKSPGTSPETSPGTQAGTQDSAPDARATAAASEPSANTPDAPDAASDVAEHAPGAHARDAQPAWLAPRRRPHVGGLLLADEETARARAAFATLSPEEQAGFVEALASEARKIQSFQMQLVNWVLAQEEIDPGLRPEAPPLGWFDPETHAPKQPIPRKVLAADSPALAIAERELLGPIAPRRAVSGWTYDYGRREVQRLPNEREPWRIFENALLGLPPYWDLVEALVEAKLDDGAHQKVLAAFGHAYTDRVGGVYPTITLYDAWISRAPIEAPDVDTLGIMHDVVGDWQTFQSIVPESQHEGLFGRIGGLVMPAYHHRSLRHALARTFVCGSTELRDGYQQHQDNFHGLWESVSSDPGALAAVLPADAQWSEFLTGLSERAGADELFALRGLRRRDTLDRNGDEVRRWLFWLLGEAEAYRRLDGAK
ncbi:MAG: hypothetical protein L6Q99_06170 [Planctomycetes bacterium]|nr:hypothetical protein [Planctomycetota bacterium]